MYEWGVFFLSIFGSILASFGTFYVRGLKSCWSYHSRAVFSYKGLTMGNISVDLGIYLFILVLTKCSFHLLLIVENIRRHVHDKIVRWIKFKSNIIQRFSISHIINTSHQLLSPNMPAVSYLMCQAYFWRPKVLSGEEYGLALVL